jgi:uncharacterized membrane protein
VGVLIYFIHHVSVSIQANEIVARVGTELIEGIERLFPENIGRGAPQIPTDPPDAHFLDTFGREARPVGSAGDGYLNFVDGNALMALAMKENFVIRLERRPGHYFVASRPLAMVWPGSRVTDQLKERIIPRSPWVTSEHPFRTLSFRSTNSSKSQYEPSLPG